MIKLLWTCSSVTTCVLLLAGHAEAQTQQTRENAQRFLGQAVEQHAPERGFYYDNGGWERVWGERYGKYVTDAAQPLKSWSAAEGDVCISEYQVKKREIDNESGKIELGSSWQSDKIQWKHVAHVEQHGASVEIRARNKRFRFTWPSEALAARAAYAMEFLRMYCDPSANTGF